MSCWAKRSQHLGASARVRQPASSVVEGAGLDDEAVGVGMRSMKSDKRPPLSKPKSVSATGPRVTGSGIPARASGAGMPGRE